jgi:hypothetical protein
MDRLSVLILSLGCGLVPGMASAQEPTEPAGQAEPVEHAEEFEHDHKNSLGFLVANTYEAEGDVNIFTIGGEYQRSLTERFAIQGVFEYGPDPNAWVFVAPFVFKVVKELEVFAGPGLEHLSRRPEHHSEVEEIEMHGPEAPAEPPEEEDVDNLFLFRVGTGYHVPLNERFFLVPHVALDFVDEEHEVAKAVVYGVTIGFGF